MTQLGLETRIQNRDLVAAVIQRLKENKVILPTFSRLQQPASIPRDIVDSLQGISPEEAHPLNLFRVHWHNDSTTGAFTEVPEHVVLPEALTGVPAPIVVMFGDTFPMISAHKVLPAYACLVPRLVTGQFNPERHRAVWPSTGNYCRGGVAISRILGCRGVAVLPEGMSRERFNWLEQWVADPADIIRTPGTESNVKEIYDQCAELAADDRNVIFNQFAEFGNYLAHYTVTGTAVEKVFTHLQTATPALALNAFVGTTGSAGTLAAGDFLKDRFGSGIAAAEPIECPTLQHNGYGEHNIQGIGDKHIPYIHNIMNTDFIIGVSDKNSDALNVLFNSDTGRAFLAERKLVDPDLADSVLGRFGLSSIANILAAIKLARYQGLSATDAVFTVATDSAAMYGTEKQKTLQEVYSGRFDELDAAETFGTFLAGLRADEVAELSLRDRERIFNLGYYTWVEQQGVALSDFDKRKDQSFWKDLRSLLPAWDKLIEDINKASGNAVD